MNQSPFPELLTNVATIAGVDAALPEIESNRGKLFDPAVVDACLRLFRVKGYQLPV